MARLGFLLRVAGASVVDRDRSCPYCHETSTAVVVRKYGLLELRRCSGCRLRFRWPKDSVRRNAAYYQIRYRQRGLTTDLPDAAQLARLVETGFRGTEKDFAEKIALLRRLCPEGRVLDFGCSWGYGVVQLATAGYDAAGFELSADRAAFGRTHLGVDILDSYVALDQAPAGHWDAIFSNHVLEHLPTPREAFAQFARLLRPGGILVAFVPNAGGASARRLGSGWGPLVCERHTLAVDREFVEPALSQHGFDVHVTSEPYRLDEAGEWIGGERRTEREDGDELLIVGRRRADHAVAGPGAHGIAGMTDGASLVGS
jgi:2-polyprenyl-3-methyl-5-hydroxy-6-metoxy-1,4-benzoquinol methylase